MHAVSALLARRVGRNGTVVCFAEDGAGVCRGRRYRAKNIRRGRFFS